MDAVITYVNMHDPIWQQQYKDACEDEPNIKRFKELGTINIQIQCIRKFMPWINNIFLVVSTESQAKDIDGVTVITHEQIIPKEYLPTFNSCTIELFLHKIPGLSDYFIYFNDDIFPINHVKETSFFDDKPILSFKQAKTVNLNIFRFQCKNSSNLARVLSGKTPTSDYIKPDHICLIHSKSVYKYIWSKVEKTLLGSISRKRTSKNFNQYLFVDYMYFANLCKIKSLNYKYLTYENYSAKDLYDIISNQQCDFVCIQDNLQDPERDESLKNALQCVLNK